MSRPSSGPSRTSHSVGARPVLGARGGCVGLGCSRLLRLPPKQLRSHVVQPRRERAHSGGEHERERGPDEVGRDVGPAERTRALPVTSEADFYDRTGRGDGCWEWPTGTDGWYAQAGGERVHRTSWEYAHGPIPGGMCVCHTCDNPPCVNPAHLFLGTHGDNADDKVAKGRQMRGEMYPGSILTEDAVRHIRTSGRSDESLGLLYGVARRTVEGVRAFRSWKHVT